jgi:drug/metabolite transporter (DMT)-like permease
LFVTFLWSTSWILIKRGLEEVPALTFAGLRYSCAFFILLPGLFKHRNEMRSLSKSQWLLLAALGIVFYALTQGGQFLTLSVLDAIPFSLMLSFTPLLVAAAGIVLLRERLRGQQWIGVAIAVVGATVYFGRGEVFRASPIGLSFGLVTLFANAGASLLGRAVNRDHRMSPWLVTTISMGIGGLSLLCLGIMAQGLPCLSLRGWGIVLWLAVVNTALAFTLWNHSLRTLAAAESSAVNNTMMIQIAILAWAFLGESVSWVQGAGLLAVALGTLLVQRRRREPSPATSRS